MSSIFPTPSVRTFPRSAVKIFPAVSGYHRKHAVRLLGRHSYLPHPSQQRLGRRIYNAAVGEALIITWEAADRICGKRLKAILPNLVDAMERHGHLRLDPEVQRGLLAASAATRLQGPALPRQGGLLTARPADDIVPLWLGG